MTKKRSVWALVCLLLCSASQSLTKTPAELLQEASYAEAIEGDLAKAIALCDQVIATPSVHRSLLAQALFRKANCLIKAQDQAAASLILERLVSEFADQTPVVEKARLLLQELLVPDPAMLMPADTLVYVEFGSPGRQIETVLKMLKGTPLENPLAAIMADKGRGQAGPQDVLGNIFNPSMLAEFKKIRGMAAGVTGMAQNRDHPPFVVVLYPGKSDALRGLLLAVLGMMGRRMDPIEGMESYDLQNTAFASYDDNVILIANPLEQLRWSIKRHKGIIKGPSLATSTGSFARLSKEIRQDNVLTLWVNVDEAFAGLNSRFSKDGFFLPHELRIADGLVDFNGIDDLTVQLAMKEQGISLEANVNLKDGHRCLAYDLIRTPNLSKAALEAVPSEAIALISFALADPQSAQAKALSERLQRVTGLDVQREIYGNIEQVILFAVPPTGNLQDKSSVPQIAHCLGLSVTSHDPQRTRQVLFTLLGAAQLIAGGDRVRPMESQEGRFQIGIVDDRPLYCHIGEAGKATILSLNPAVVESAVRAQKTGSSVCKSGPLSKAVNALPASTSKLILVNPGGSIRMIQAHVPFQPDANNPLVRAVEQLAQACDESVIQVYTSEQVNQLTFKAGLDNLPPFNQIWGPIMQLSQVMQPQKKAWSGKGGRSTVTAEVGQATAPPIIDGKIEDLWAKAKAYELKNSLYDPVSGPEDCSASFRALWDKDNLYVLVQVQDEDLRNDSEDYWEDDAVEVFIDADNAKAGEYGSNDYRYHFDWDPASPQMGEAAHEKTQGVRYVMLRTDNGYTLEVGFPWTTLGVKPRPGSSIGLDVQVNDDDGGGGRDHKLAWSATEDDAWQNPSVFGNAVLAGLVAWWRLDEKGGDSAYDSSGNGHTGILKGNPTWQPSGGRVGGGLHLDGVDDYVETEYATDLPCWTLAVWVKSPVGPTEGDPSGPVHREKNLQINWNHPLEYARGTAMVCTGGTWRAATFGQLTADTWYHLVASYDGQTLKAYKDGVLVSISSGPSVCPDHEDSSLKLGRHSTKPHFFKGTIDDVRIYSYALTDPEVGQLYRSTISGSQ